MGQLVPSSTVYVGGGLPMKTADLIAAFPPGPAVVGMYARVSDLYGAIDDIMRCRYDGTAYRWVPQRESYAGNVPVSAGSISITALGSPPTILFTGTLTGNVNATPSMDGAYLGCRKRLIQNSTLGTSIMTVTGLVGSNLTLLGNSVHELEVGPSGWFAAS